MIEVQGQTNHKELAMKTNVILDNLMIFLCLLVFTLIVFTVGVMVGGFWMDEFFPTATPTVPTV